MHQGAEICLPRKKKVHNGFHPNTFRIFDENVPDRIPPDKVYHDHKYATRSAEESQLLQTHNTPQPYNAKFIRTNVRFLNAPVVHMETDNAKDEQFKWWATVSVDGERPKALYSVDTTQRTDYQATTPSPVTRANDERGRAFASAIIPTLEPLGQPKTLLEHMSFTHQYDSRKLHNQPYQGGRHGTFVWTELTRPQGQVPPSSAPCAKPGPEDTNVKDPSGQHLSPSSSSSTSTSSSSSAQLNSEGGGRCVGTGRGGHGGPRAPEGGARSG
ncbi:uncharacterized protein C2orf73 homolog [Sardina pilchardus]|uniref:uncharacterized protein C2orf73 homolog n=1 Tax=Sardina pilchardus TaxID=27697 RepID=UPI002E14822F